jgi:hypothetical protein
MGFILNYGRLVYAILLAHVLDAVKGISPQMVLRRRKFDNPLLASGPMKEPVLPGRMILRRPYRQNNDPES